jgi:hypothetical protein
MWLFRFLTITSEQVVASDYGLLESNAMSNLVDTCQCSDEVAVGAFIL